MHTQLNSKYINVDTVFKYILKLAHVKLNWFKINQKVQLDYKFLKISLALKIVF